MMFDETDPYGRLPRGHYRPLNRIPDSLPTFPAAEVQVLDPVPVEDILGAFVPRAEWEKRLRPHFDAMPGPPREIVLAAEHGCYRVRDRCWGFPDSSEVPGAADRNEMRELYDACAHEEGEPAYLGDGVYIDLPRMKRSPRASRIPEDLNMREWRHQRARSVIGIANPTERHRPRDLKQELRPP